MKIKSIKNILLFLSLIVFFAVTVPILIYFIISYTGNSLLYDDINKIPPKKVGLVLGTSKYYKNGTENFFFTHRIDAAAELYKSGKVQYLLLSGDNRYLTYNEPIMMKKAIQDRGIPDSVIFLDYAGFRTLDAVVRSNAVFGENDIIIISQKFHNQRAIFLAKSFKVKAIAYNAKDVAFKKGYRTKLREIPARMKAFMDVYLFNTRPKFLGEPIKIE